MKSVAALLTIPATTVGLASVSYAGGGALYIDTSFIEGFVEAMNRLLFALVSVIS